MGLIKPIKDDLTVCRVWVTSQGSMLCATKAFYDVLGTIVERWRIPLGPASDPLPCRQATRTRT